jgi:hypothetical protein
VAATAVQQGPKAEAAVAGPVVEPRKIADALGPPAQVFAVTECLLHANHQ